MIMKFNLAQLFEEESLKEEPFVTQRKIKVQEKEPAMVQRGDKEENDIILDLEEKDVESKPTLEVVLCTYCFLHPLLYFPLSQFEIEENISKEALLLFSMSKLKNKVVYDIFPMDAWNVFFGRPSKFGPKIICH